jgi:hypothetical protein
MVKSNKRSTLSSSSFPNKKAKEDDKNKKKLKEDDKNNKVMYKEKTSRTLGLILAK